MLQIWNDVHLISMHYVSSVFCEWPREPPFAPPVTPFSNNCTRKKRTLQTSGIHALEKIKNIQAIFHPRHCTCNKNIISWFVGLAPFGAQGQTWGEIAQSHIKWETQYSSAQKKANRPQPSFKLYSIYESQEFTAVFSSRNSLGHYSKLGQKS